MLPGRALIAHFLLPSRTRSTLADEDIVLNGDYASDYEKALAVPKAPAHEKKIELF